VFSLASEDRPLRLADYHAFYAHNWEESLIALNIIRSAVDAILSPLTSLSHWFRGGLSPQAPEVVSGHVSSDGCADSCALHVRGAEMDTSPDAGFDNLLDRL
jgi:hypothetical protein